MANENKNNVNENGNGNNSNAPEKTGWFTAHKTGIMAVLTTLGNVLLEVLVGVLTIVGAGLVIGKMSGATTGRSRKYIKYNPDPASSTRPDVPTHVPETTQNNN